MEFYFLDWSKQLGLYYRCSLIPIVYERQQLVPYNKSLSLVEQNYEIHNKKILTIIHALEE